MNTRNRIRTLLTLAAVVMAIIGFASPSSGAGGLSHDGTVMIFENGPNYNLSVYPGKASYSAFGGDVTGVFGDGTVLDYRFFSSDGDNMYSYADGGAGRIAVVPSPPPENVDGASHWHDIWTTNDPGTEFTGGDPANYTYNTMARAQNFTGTIDISGLRSGTVYFLYGSYIDYNIISLTMSGAGQPDVVADHWETAPEGNIGWISSFGFYNATDYDTITYTYNNNDLDASGARFTGVIIDGVDDGGPQDLSPEDRAVVEPGDVDLSWTNMPPNVGDTVWVDVWFGTDPDALTLVVDADIDGENVTAKTVSASGFGTYHWQVNSYVDGSPTGSPVLGPVYSFFTDVPISSVDAGADMITWSGKAVQLAPTVDYEGKSALTYLWSADPNEGVVFSATDVNNPTVTITKLPVLVPFVANGGFELPVLGNGTSVLTPVPSWDTYWSVPGSGVWTIDGGTPNGGAVNPDAGYGYDGVAIEGENVGFITADPLSDHCLYQELTEIVQASTQYDLSVKVGNPQDFATADYSIELVAGGVVVASTSGASPNGITDPNWFTVSLGYTSGADAGADPNIGQPLRIRLIAKVFGVTDLNFDDVNLLINGQEGLVTSGPAVSTVTLTLAVNNEVNPDPVTDTMSINVYGNACLAAVGKGFIIDQTDFDEDCITNFKDFAVLAATWLDNYKPTGPVVKP
jgi:hypothetical protein